MEAIVLCGGRGTRLASVVSDVPKPLAMVAGRPFLDWLLAGLDDSGVVDRVALATGHLGQRIREHYGTRFGRLALRYSHEEQPLGTGGAILQALRGLPAEAPLLVANGDSYVDADLAALADLARQQPDRLAMAVLAVPDCARFGTVTLDDGRVSAFREKRGVAEPGWINAGLYAFAPALLAAWQDSALPLSLEQQVLPLLAAQGRLTALCCHGRFIDIGLPETYAAASAFFAPP